MPGKKGSESNPIFFKGPEQFRDWLAKNHDTADELWIGFWKVSTGKPSITWSEAIDEELCYGWIDGIRKGIDAYSYKQRFTPRRPRSIWSRINIARVEALKKQGRMKPAGLAAYEKRDVTSVYAFEQGEGVGLAAREQAALKKNTKAWEFFMKQPPYYRKVAGWWVMSAKKEETRQRRLETLIRDSAAGRRYGPMAPTKSKR